MIQQTNNFLPTSNSNYMSMTFPKMFVVAFVGCMVVAGGVDDDIGFLVFVGSLILEHVVFVLVQLLCVLRGQACNLWLQ